MKFDFRLMMRGAVGPAGVGSRDLSRFERRAAGPTRTSPGSARAASCPTWIFRTGVPTRRSAKAETFGGDVATTFWWGTAGRG